MHLGQTTGKWLETAAEYSGEGPMTLQALSYERTQMINKPNCHDLLRMDTLDLMKTAVLGLGG